MPTKVIKSEGHSRLVRKISGVITNSGTPTVSTGSGYTLTDNGVGDITVTLSKPGRTVLGGSAMVINTTGATGHFAKIHSLSASAMRILTYVADATDGAPADVDCCFEITVRDV